MADSNLLVFFTQMESLGRTIVQDPPKLDLELYIGNYRGRTRFRRLFHIGRTCVPLCVEALKLAVAEAKQGNDLRLYKDAWECLRVAAPEDQDAIVDREWMLRVEKENAVKAKELESNLATYRNNLVKESIRIGHEDLGSFYERIGDLVQAQDYYMKMRSDSSIPRHIIELGKHLTRLAIERDEWNAALVNINKIASAGVGAESELAHKAYVGVVSGLCLMGRSEYASAAASFLQTDAHCVADCNDLLSANDVAVYGGLLAFATMDRKSLRDKVLNNRSFKLFLELEPQIRKAIGSFVNCRYSQCLEILESYRADFMCDVHLYRHVPELFQEIRRKCMVEYFGPFSHVTLGNMQDIFGPPSGEPILDEIIAMIRDGTLKARIDMKEKLLIDVTLTGRPAMQRTALDTATKYEREAKNQLRRIAIVSAGLDHKPAYTKTDHERLERERLRQIESQSLQEFAGARGWGDRF